MTFIDSKGGTIATKVAAVYRLREFSQDREFIIRFCETQRDNIQGEAAKLLRDEMDATAAFLRQK